MFTLGTRLTRITPALRIRRSQTRARPRGRNRRGLGWRDAHRPDIAGVALGAAICRLARGAAIVLLSDGLERGCHAEMTQAFRRLKGLAFRLSLLTPLAADPRFRPRTAALAAVLPYLDDLADGSEAGAVTGFILSLARPAKPAGAIWREDVPCRM